MHSSSGQNELKRKIERVLALYERPGSEGEKRAAAIALHKLQTKLNSLNKYAGADIRKYEFTVFKSV